MLLTAPVSFRTNLGDEFVESSRPYRHEQAQVVASRGFRILKDTDAMPFGCHKDSEMQDVPASYLDQLRDADWLDGRYPAVAEYIERNASAIDHELDRAERNDR